MGTEQARSGRGPLLALASAALFGASTPFAKMLLGQISPWVLAGLLYSGAGVGLAALRALAPHRPEAPLSKSDLPTLVAVIVSGGIVAPVLMMLGLTVSSGSMTALLLNLEGVFTLGIAWLVFREHVDLRVGSGAALILIAAAVLSWQGNAGVASWGGLAIAAACLAWAIDNNLTRSLSAADPLQVAMIKDLIAGASNLVLALLAGARFPHARELLLGAALGFFGYGLSLVLFVLALRHLGTARSGAYFSVAPFVGAALALGLLHEPITTQLAGAALLMMLGLWLQLSEHHAHEHEHEPLTHEHGHVHDAHHQHEHLAGDPAGEPHTHTHTHARLVHAHPHFPDLHHRHRH